MSRKCPECGADLGTPRNPFPTVDIIIECETEEGEKGIVLINRKNPPLKWAIPGGFVDYGETLEEAAMREAREETCLEVELEGQFHAYSAPMRDPRMHTITTVFLAKAKGRPRGSDDAKEAAVFHENDLPELAFDHAQILKDYFSYRAGKNPWG